MATRGTRARPWMRCVKRRWCSKRPSRKRPPRCIPTRRCSPLCCRIIIRRRGRGRPGFPRQPSPSQRSCSGLAIGQPLSPAVDRWTGCSVWIRASSCTSSRQPSTSKTPSGREWSGWSPTTRGPSSCSSIPTRCTIPTPQGPSTDRISRTATPVSCRARSASKC